MILKTEKNSVRVAARHLSELLNRLAYQGSNFELIRSGKNIGRLAAAGSTKRIKVADLNRLFGGLRGLGDDAEVFARDIEKTRRNLPLEKDLWN